MPDQIAHGVPDGDDAARIMDAIRALVRALRVSGRAVERAIGISGAQLFVLEQLRDSPVSSVNELAERTKTHQTTVSVVVARLVKRGLVTRETATEDARRVQVFITQRGREMLASAPETAHARIVAALQRTSPEQVAGLADALATLVRTMGLTDAPVSMLFEEDADPY